MISVRSYFVWATWFRGEEDEAPRSMVISVLLGRPNTTENISDFSSPRRSPVSCVYHFDLSFVFF